eukprot:TRINITY_DN6508_c0_g1_i1.p1 TRINITY_DN6508_c0_g1~~TRINITY_DN6508_c0_g1_i1.p1  ORF type:complete len:425 (-),score=120.88 TRINITY_DN6508_c0_g1_i1:65-1339(-)
MNKYKIISKKGEGTFSEVLKVQGKNNTFYAVKRMKNKFESMEQVTNLREVQAIRRLSPHPQIVKLHEVIFEKQTGSLYLVFELMELNLYEMIKGRKQFLPESQLKSLMFQSLKGLDHMHRNGIFHRDIKPENMMIKDDKLKLCDFGSCRGIRSKQPYTEYISTRWYRAPECLLTDGYYNYKMDIWGIGCVWFEILALFPLFPGTNELDQIQRIHNIMGTPPRALLDKFRKHSVHMNVNFPEKEGTGIARLIPHASPEALDLISRLLTYNPDERISARTALQHPYFRDLVEKDRLERGTPLVRELDGAAASTPTLPAASASSASSASSSGPAHARKSSNSNAVVGNAAANSGQAQQIVSARSIEPSPRKATEKALPMLQKPAQSIFSEMSAAPKMSTLPSKGGFLPQISSSSSSGNLAASGGKWK